MEKQQFDELVRLLKQIDKRLENIEWNTGSIDEILTAQKS